MKVQGLPNKADMYTGRMVRNSGRRL